MKRIILLFFILVPLIVFAQTTGFTDTFDGELTTTGPATFELTQANGELHVGVHKNASTTWQGIKYSIGTVLNITSSPYVMVKLKTDKSFILTIYIMDQYSTPSNVSRKIYASDEYVNYFFDFSDISGADKSMIYYIQLTPNGNTQDAFSANLYIDDMVIGTDAFKMADIGAIPSQQAFINSFENRINVLDVLNASQITASSVNGSITNINVGNISNGRATISYDAPGSGLYDELLITATGGPGFADNTVLVPVTIQENLPPTIDAVPDLYVMAGDTTVLDLTGISDGNSTVDQSLIITATSNDQTVLPDSAISVQYQDGFPTAQLALVAMQPSNNLQLAITVDDQYTVDNIFETTVNIDVYAQINNPPEINEIDDRFVYLENGAQSIQLDGISDGDDQSQTLSFDITSSDNSVIDSGSLSVTHTQGDNTALLNFTPLQSGTTDITLTVSDNGGTDSNNGDQQTVLTFSIEVGTLPVTGHVADFSSFENLEIDDEGNSQIPELGTFKGRDNVLKITVKNKSCWTGTLYSTPEMNVDEHRYISYDMYVEGESFDLPDPYTGQGFSHCYFWDEGWDADLNRNVNAAHDQRKHVIGEEWYTVVMDFRGAGGMDNAENEEINVHRIQKILLNYASEFVWPFPSDNGTVYISNLKIGSAVPDSLLPEIPSICTMDPVAAQSVYVNSGPQTVTLTGISAGTNNLNPVSLEITSSDTTLIPAPVVSAVQDSQATLTIQPAPDATGTATISVVATADGAQQRIRRFNVDVIAREAMITLEINRDTLFQEIRGFGTFQFEDQQHYLDLYTDDLGASAVRTGLISNQIEPVNDNEDPNVLNLDGYDQSAFDFDYYRRLKAKGVETFILTSWSPPAWMKRNLSVSYAYASAPEYERTDNILEPYYYQEFAESMVAAVKMFNIYAGVDLYAIGPQNEPAFCEPYASAVLDPKNYARLTEIIGKRFEAEGITSKLYLPEQVFTQNHYSMAEYITALKQRPEAEKYTDIIATHGYDDTGVTANQPTFKGWSDMWKDALSCEYDKELWMSETFPEYETWDDALSLASAIHGALVWGNVSLWTLWSIEGTLINQGEPTPSFYTSKNFYKYIRPGARRVRALIDHQNILVSAFIHPETMRQTLVIVNREEQAVNINLTGANHAVSYEQYTTQNHRNFEFKGTVSSNGQVLLPASSVTTLTGFVNGPVITDIDQSDALPATYQLYQNYPNPFNPVTTIRFNLPISAHTSILVFNVMGQKVRTLADHSFSAGQHELVWNGLNDNDMKVSSGVYFYRIKSGDFIKTLKCVLIK